jgi:hypothetical protein
VRVLTPERCARWKQDLYWFEQNITISSLRQLALLTLLLINARSRGISGREREREEAPKSLVVEEVKLRAIEWSPN